MSNALHVSDFLRPNKGNAAFNMAPKLEEFKQIYFERASKDMLVSCVHNEKHDRWMFFFKYPSGENDKYPTAIMYDVLIEFNPPNKNARETGNLDIYDIYIFSNSPGFVFTFDYVIKRKIGFPKCLPSSYLSKIAITKPPRIRNTFEVMTVEKTTWICFFHLYRNGYLTKETARQLINKTKNEGYFLKNMATQPQKLQEVKAMQDLLKSEKAAEKARDKNKALARNYNSTHSDPSPTPLNKDMSRNFDQGSLFKSGMKLINPSKFLNIVSKRNHKGNDAMFKADKKLKFNFKK